MKRITVALLTAVAFLAVVDSAQAQYRYRERTRYYNPSTGSYYVEPTIRSNYVVPEPRAIRSSYYYEPGTYVEPGTIVQPSTSYYYYPNRTYYEPSRFYYSGPFGTRIWIR